MSSARIFCAVTLRGCKRAGELLKSSGRVRTALWPGIAAMPRRFARCATSRSLTSGLGGGSRHPGGESGVFSRPSLLPYTPISNSTLS